MRHIIVLFTVIVGLASLAMPTSTVAETTLEKIGRTGILVIGTRTSSPPFAYVTRNNEWVGFTIDLVEQGVLPAVSKSVGKRVRLEKTESTLTTRITLLLTRAVDLIAGTMTDAPQRRRDVDFSLTFFLTGGQFLVKKGSPIKGIDDIAGKRIGTLEGRPMRGSSANRRPRPYCSNTPISQTPSEHSCAEGPMLTPTTVHSFPPSSTRHRT